MKKIISAAIVVIMAAALAVSAQAAAVANHLFDKQGGIDAGGKTWSVYGWIVTDAEITSVGYILDDGDISSYKAVVTGIEKDTRQRDDTKKGVSDAYRDLALEDAVKGGGMSGGVSWDVLRAYRIQIIIDISGLAEGEHTILLCAEFLEGGMAEVFRDHSEFKFKKGGAAGGTGSSTLYMIDSDDSDDARIKATGWAGCTVKTEKLGYKIDNGETVYNDKYVKLIPLDEMDTDDAAVIDLAGQFAFRFKVDFPINELPAGFHHIKLVMQEANGGETVVGSGGGNEELIFSYESDEEAVTDVKTEPATAAATEPDTKADTSPATSAVTGNQTEPAGTEAPSTGDLPENETKGLPSGAIIAVIAAAVVAAGTVAVIVLKRRK